ncbi:MAG TPA: YHS domain-containing protein [Fimbriimonas sp.]|nr:YHS domain-containing protein [Fimbriimonas sp.]
MKKFLVALMATAIVGAAFADKDPKELKCAVMPADKVVIATATKKKMYSDYKGRRYFFCCAGCKPTFEKDPAKYAKTAPSIKTPKAKTK